MPDPFCTQCGQRLTGAARFCDNCGSAVAMPTAGKAGSPAKGADLFERLGLKVLAIGAKKVPDLQNVEGVAASVLDLLLSCSLMNAPLSTDFLAVENLKEERWIGALEWLQDMHGLKVICGLTVVYSVAGPYSPSLDECYRSDFPEEVANAYIEAQKRSYLKMVVRPSFEPQTYGEFDEQLRGRWRTVQIQDENKRYEVATIAPLTPSGFIMKGRLREHEAYLSQWIAKERDSSTKKTLEEIRGVARASIQAMPDGFADHILCEAYQMEDGQVQSLALMKEWWEQEEEKEKDNGKQKKTVAFRKASRPSAASDAFRHKGIRAGTGERRAPVPRTARIQPFWRAR